ncbi:MAG TPA: arylsulfotransferase family protein [Conexibacter sp.]|nr:arylsulfotransferase family protein [Conexibacter sp.]
MRAGRGLTADHHELQLTPRGTAYVTAYARRRIDLRAVGGPRRGTNAVDPGPHGTLLISARNTHAIYDVSKRGGRILWRLGGKRSDFRMGPGARFAFQHDVTWLGHDELSLFDNEATPPRARESRGLVLALDFRTRTARVVRAYPHPDHLLIPAEGNVQTLPDGHVFTSWGVAGHVSELARDGRLLLDLVAPPGADTYQAFRSPWRGAPLDRPALAAQRTGDGPEVTAWASWNGATDVRAWQLLAGPSPARLRPLGGPVPRSGFETVVHARTSARWIAVRAVGARGRPLATSPPRE